MLERTRAAIAQKPFDWLAAILLSWLVPLGPVGRWWGLTYRLSLWFWVVPIVLLLPRFPSVTGRVRLAIYAASLKLPPLWAFVTATNNETQDVTVISPQ